MSENRPSLALLKLDLKLYFTLDKYISITNDSTVNFHKKMGLFQTIGSRLTLYCVHVFCLFYLLLLMLRIFSVLVIMRSGFKCE